MPDPVTRPSRRRRRASSAASRRRCRSVRVRDARSRLLPRQRSRVVGPRERRPAPLGAIGHAARSPRRRLLLRPRHRHAALLRRRHTAGRRFTPAGCDPSFTLAEAPEPRPGHRVNRLGAASCGDREPRHPSVTERLHCRGCNASSTAHAASHRCARHASIPRARASSTATASARTTPARKDSRCATRGARRNPCTAIRRSTPRAGRSVTRSAV